MMKKQFIAFATMGLIAVSQMAMSSEQESVEQRCEQQAIEEKVSDDEYEAFMEECIALNQEGESQREEEPEKD
jgi:hypothetical protein